MRRNFVKRTILVSVLTALMAMLPSLVTASDMPLMIPVLFVQNAKAVVFDKGTLTLIGVSPMTVFFSDRPVRIAGHFNTKDEFVPLWRGEEQFSQGSSQRNRVHV